MGPMVWEACMGPAYIRKSHVLGGSQEAPRLRLFHSRLPQTIDHAALIAGHFAHSVDVGITGTHATIHHDATWDWVQISVQITMIHDRSMKKRVYLPTFIMKINGSYGYFLKPDFLLGIFWGTPLLFPTTFGVTNWRFGRCNLQKDLRENGCFSGSTRIWPLNESLLGKSTSLWLYFLLGNAGNVRFYVCSAEPA